MTGKKNVSLPCAVGSTSYIDTVKNSYYVDKNSFGQGFNR